MNCIKLNYSLRLKKSHQPADSNDADDDDDDDDKDKHLNFSYTSSTLDNHQVVLFNLPNTNETTVHLYLSLS